MRNNTAKRPGLPGRPSQETPDDVSDDGDSQDDGACTDAQPDSREDYNFETSHRLDTDWRDDPL